MEGRGEALTGVPLDGGTLTIRAMSEPAGLNPLDDAYRDGWVLRITRGLVLESLLTIRASDEGLAPGLADFSESPDHRTVTFTLRPARFTDGHVLDADDVVASFEALLGPGHPTGALRGELGDLRACRKVDARTVVLEWGIPSWRTLRAVTEVPILEAEQVRGDWAALAAAPIGTGPYVVGKWDRGQSLTLDRKDATRAHLEHLIFRFVKDHTTAAAMNEKGEFDLMTNVLPVNWRAMEKEPTFAWARSGYQRLRSIDNSFSYIAWNETRPPLEDVHVRRALAHLYDSALISKVVDLGLELPTSCPFLHGSDSCADAGAPLFSTELARAELADAGFTDTNSDGVLERDGQPLKLTFLLPGTSVRLGKILPLFQEQLKAVGGVLELERVETTTLTARIARRDFDAVSRVWTEFDREQDLYPLFHSSQRDGGANIANYSNGEVDALLEGIRAERDVVQRRSLERRLHLLLREEQPWLLMTSRQSLDLAKNRVHGLVPSLHWYDLREVWVQP